MEQGERCRRTSHCTRSRVSLEFVERTGRYVKRRVLNRLFPLVASFSAAQSKNGNSLRERRYAHAHTHTSHPPQKRLYKFHRSFIRVRITLAYARLSRSLLPRGRDAASASCSRSSRRWVEPTQNASRAASRLVSSRLVFNDFN